MGLAYDVCHLTEKGIRIEVYYVTVGYMFDSRRITEFLNIEYDEYVKMANKYNLYHELYRDIIFYNEKEIKKFIEELEPYYIMALLSN